MKCVNIIANRNAYQLIRDNKKSYVVHRLSEETIEIDDLIHFIVKIDNGKRIIAKDNLYKVVYIENLTDEIQIISFVKIV